MDKSLKQQCSLEIISTAILQPAANIDQEFMRMNGMQD